jgi:KDO2-lipid IV(A) lauroyltransferase
MAARIRIRGARHLDEALALGRGVIVVTFHFGNWELAGAYLAGLGYPVSVVVQRIHNPFLDRMVADARTDAGMRTIPRGAAVRGAVRALKENRVVGILSDQDAREGGVFVPFFDRPASTPRGPAVLSLRRDAPAVTALMVRGERGSFELRIEPIEFERAGNLEEDVERFTAAYTARLEAYVRRHPEQWLWQHRRWKTTPAGTG